MSVAKALNDVSRAYVPGVAAYYGKLNPDPWQAAHDTLEKHMLLKDPAILDAAAEAFAKRCKELIARFERDGAASDEITEQDAFHIGDEERVRQMQSRKYRECIDCQSKEGLKIQSDPDDPGQVWLICGPCLRGHA